MKKALVFFLICSLVFVPVASGWNGEPAATYPTNEYDVWKILVVVGGVLALIPTGGWVASWFMEPSPQEKLELDMKKKIYSSLGDRAAKRVETWSDSQIDQMIILGLGGQVSPPPSQPSPPHVQPQPGLWQPAPLPEYQSGGGVYLINASQIQEYQ